MALAARRESERVLIHMTIPLSPLGEVGEGICTYIFTCSAGFGDDVFFLPWKWAGNHWPLRVYKLGW